jgi:hypothetical protein
MRRLMVLTALALLVAVAPLAAAPLPAGKTALAQVPASAPMVVQLRGIEGTADRLIAYLKNALPEQALLIAPLIKTFTEGVGERKLAGLAKDGPHLAAFLEMPKEGMEGLPKVAIILSTTDNKEFLDGVLKDSEKKALKKEEGGYKSTVIEDNGDPMFIVERQGYVILTPRKEVAKEMVTKGVGLDTRMSDELMEKFLALDLGLYVGMDVLNKDYAEQIKQAKKLALDELKAGAVGGAIEKAQMELITTAVGAGFQAVEDSKGIIAGLEFRPTAINLHAETEVRPGTATSKTLGELKVSKFENLAKMPAGSLFFLAGEMNAPILNAFKSVLYGQGIDPESKEGKAVAAAAEALVKARPTTLVQSASVPTSGISVWSAEDPKALVAAQLKLIEAMGDGKVFGGVPLKEKPTIKANAQKYRDINFTQIKLTIDPEKISGQLNDDQLALIFGAEATKKVAEELKKLLSEPMEVYLGIDGQQMVQVTARNWATAEKMLAGYYEGKGTIRFLDGYSQIRKDLPPAGNLLVLVDLPAYLEVVFNVFKPALEARLPAALPPKYPAPAPQGSAGYVGFALTLNKDRASADLVISAESVLVTYKRFGAPFLGLR